MTHKLAVVGAGYVGKDELADAMKTGLFSDIVVVDQDQEAAFGAVLDQVHAAALTYMTNVEAYAGGYEDFKNADVIIVSADPSVVVGEGDQQLDRALLAEENSANIREVITGITE